MRTVDTKQGQIEVPDFDPDTYDFSQEPPITVVPYNAPDRSSWQKLKDLYKRTRYVTTDHWYVKVDLAFVYPGTFNTPSIIILWMPMGFFTDFASILRVLTWLPGLSPTGPIGRGAPPHDLGYRTTCLLDCYGHVLRFNREEIDRVMLYINLHRSGYPKIANIAFNALRAFGYFSWRKARKNNPDNLIDLYGEYK
jgi:hypothetical protein